MEEEKYEEGSLSACPIRKRRQKPNSAQAHQPSRLLFADYDLDRLPKSLSLLPAGRTTSSIFSIPHAQTQTNDMATSATPTTNTTTTTSTHKANPPPTAIPVQYSTPYGTRWGREAEAAGGTKAFDYPTDPKAIGPWVIGECIGKGASGRVKIARHKHTGQLAAVKILPLAPLINSRASFATRQAKAEKQRLGIDREITMMKLMNHPNIMRIYDVYEGANELFLVLEYVQGGELFDFLVNRGRLRPREALAFFKQIIHGLNYAHTFSIIHRDLKPENILISSLNPLTIKIADWGMAAFAPPTLQLETSCGSPHYASPEIVNGEKYQGTATDIWSCGVILFALLTGRLPFDDKNVRHLLEKVKIGKYETPAWIDPVAADLLSRMLKVDSSKRITVRVILSYPFPTLIGCFRFLRFSLIHGCRNRT